MPSHTRWSISAVTSLKVAFTRQTFCRRRPARDPGTRVHTIPNPFATSIPAANSTTWVTSSDTSAASPPCACTPSPALSAFAFAFFLAATAASLSSGNQQDEAARGAKREKPNLIGVLEATVPQPARSPPGGPPLPWTVTTLGSLGTGGTPMVTKYQKFGDGYKAEAVKLYRESNQTIAETARNLGLKESTLANWVKKDKENEAVAVGEAPLTPAERTRIRELEADVRRLNMENAFLKKASAYFASQNL